MIKVYCDCCKEPIDNFGDQVTVSFNNCLINAVEDEFHFHTACAVRVKNILNDFLSRPVQDEKEYEERKHGTWELKHVGHGHYWECSVCRAKPNIYITKETNFCPSCGAKMDLWEGAKK